MSRSDVPPLYLLLIPLGFIIWSIAFVTLYAVNAIGCAFGWDIGVQRAVLIALTLGFLALSTLASFRIWRFWTGRARHQPAPASSLAQIGTYTALSALIASLGTFVPGLAVSLCI